MPTDLTLAELSALADVSTRTIRYYIAQGLLPSPGREGPATRYPVSALHRLRLIRQLQRGHLPLAEIRRRLAGLDDAELEALASEAPDERPADSALEYVRAVLGSLPAAGPSAAASPRPLARASIAPAEAPRTTAASEAPAPDSEGSTVTPAPLAPPLERSQWEHVVLEPDIELHLRRPLSRPANKRVERLIAFARQLLEEDQP